MNRIKYRWKEPLNADNFEVEFGEGNFIIYRDIDAHWYTTTERGFNIGSIEKKFEKEYKQYIREEKLKRILNV